jgi:hypothetical protein
MSTAAGGYRAIEFWRFALALGIVAVPALALERINPRWAWGYAFLILLSLAVFYANGLQSFGAFVQGALKG